MHNFTFKLYMLVDYGKFCDGENTKHIFTTRREAVDYWSAKSGKPADHAPVDKIAIESKAELVSFIRGLMRGQANV